MPITAFALICATITVMLLISVYLLYAMRRKNGKSDIRHSRTSLVIASFIVPIVVTTLFVVAAVLAQKLYQYHIPVGQYGGGVFKVLITTVASSVLTLIVLISRIKHKWED